MSDETISTFATESSYQVDYVQIIIFIAIGYFAYKFIEKNIIYEKLNPIIMSLTFLLIGFMLYSIYSNDNFELSNMNNIEWLIIGFILPHLDKRNKLKKE